jgi:transcriptional regulator with XRE-family HTH domain
METWSAERALGRLLYERRLALEMSLLQVSRRCDLSLLALCEVERGRGQVPAARTLKRLGEALGLPWLHRINWRSHITRER